MGINGKLSTMSLTDLLQWASVNRKTGVLEIERNKVRKQIAFRQGRIVACYSNEPSAKLGQFLLSRAKITEENLRDALALQEQSGKNLGVILRETGVMEQDELSSQVAAKAEETIFSLFDWSDAVFRFEDNAEPNPHLIEVNLTVEDIVLRGLQRSDDLKMIRDVFHSSGVVLARTTETLPREVEHSGMARRITACINGSRTLAEVLLHANASEFLVLKFLYQLYNRGLVRVTEVRSVESDAPTLLDDGPEFNAPAAPDPAEEKEGHSPTSPPADGPEKEGYRAELNVASRLISRDEHAAALEVLNACYRAHPGDEQLQHLIRKAESAFIDRARCELSPTAIPELVRAAESLADEALSPDVSYLLSLVDGQTEIKSIIWLAPLREVEALRALQRMLDKGLIRLKDSAESQPEPPTSALASSS